MQYESNTFIVLTIKLKSVSSAHLFANSSESKKCFEK